MDMIIYLQIFTTILVLVYGCRFLNWVWFRPRWLEKRLRQQGFSGNSYKLFYGDSEEMKAMTKEALSKPIINFSHDFAHRVMPIFLVALKRFGKNCFVWFGSTPAIVVFDPENAREVVSKGNTFRRPPGRAITRLMAKGIISLEADEWAKHRKLLNPAFHVEKIKHMVPSIYMSCVDMLSKWDEMIPSEESCELDVWPYIQLLTTDVMSRTSFGNSYLEGRKIFALQNEVAQHVMVANRSINIPGLSLLPTKANRRIEEITKEVKSTLLQIINRRTKAMEAGEEGSRGDLLGLLLESNSKEIKENGNKFGMSMDEVIEECKLFYFAGQETTASLLIWTMILLAKYTDWQDRARDEVMGVFGKGEPDYQDLNHLKIVTMILHEVLRLYVPGIFLRRFTYEECRLGDVCLPAGVQLMVPVLLLHHDPKIWGDDAKEFKPERFSEGVPKAAKKAYFPFGWGPRICIAQNFAMLEAKMAVAMILHSYSFELSPSYTHAPHKVITLQPQHGAHLILTKLQR